MAALTAVFSRLLSMAVAALPVMALVLAVRAALGRAPARYRYGPVAGGGVPACLPGERGKALEPF